MRLDPISSLATLSLAIVAVYINNGYVNANNINNNTLGCNEGGNRFAQASRRSDKPRLALFAIYRWVQYKWGRSYRAILRAMWCDSTFKSVISISHHRFRQAKRSLDRARVTMCPVHCLPTFV